MKEKHKAVPKLWNFDGYFYMRHFYVTNRKKFKEKTYEYSLVFKIAAIGIIVAILNQLLIRSGREEQAMLTTLAGLIVVLFIIIEQISALFKTIKTVFAL